MKGLKKLALATAVTMISAGAFAMEAADDEVLSATTGQDGITVKVIPGLLTTTQLNNMGVTTPISNYPAGTLLQAIDGAQGGYRGLSIGEIRVHDRDGVDQSLISSSSYTGYKDVNSGALVIGGGGTQIDGTVLTATQDRTVVYTNQASPIQIDIDSVGGTAPLLNVRIVTPTLQIKTGAIYVADSNGDSLSLGAGHGDVAGSTVSNKVAILNSMTMTLGETFLNVQLGNEAQKDSNNITHMIVLNTSMTGGLSINNFSLNDSAPATAPTVLGQSVTGGGSISVGSMTITDNGGSNLTVNAYVDVGKRNSAVFAGSVDKYANSPSLLKTSTYLGSQPVLDAAVAATATTAQKNAAIDTATGGAVTDYATATAAQQASANALLYSSGSSAAVAGATTAQRDAAITAATNGAVTTYAGASAADQASADAVIASNYKTTVNQGVVGAAFQQQAQDVYNGLVVTLAQLGDVNNGADIAMNRVRLGDSNAGYLGDVQIIGLNINGTQLVISGH